MRYKKIINLKFFLNYIRETIQFSRKYKLKLSLYNLIRFYPSWAYRLASQSSPLDEGIPWITFEAIEFLKKSLRKDMSVFEYGSGGSTVFFAKRVKKIITVEHNPEWNQKVLDTTKKHGFNNCEINLTKPVENSLMTKDDPGDPYGYISNDETFYGYTFKEYVSSIDIYPDGYFDLILIDGRARPSCFVHSLPKVKPDGYIMWDNTERSYYLRAMQMAPKNSKFIDFPGPTLYLRHFTRTSVWRVV